MRSASIDLPAAAAFVLTIVFLVAAVAVVTLAVNPRVRRADAYRALDAVDTADDRVRLANAMVDGDPPNGFTPGPRIHKAGTLAHLRYETFDADGRRLDDWQVRALVPPLAQLTAPVDGAYETNGCPAECQAEIARGMTSWNRAQAPENPASAAAVISSWYRRS